MPTLGTVNTTLIKVWIGEGAGVSFTCLTDATITFSMEPRDTTCKDSGSWRNALPGKKAFEISGSGYFAYDATNGFDAILALITADTKARVLWGTGVVGDKKYGGEGYFTQLEGNGNGTDSNAEYSFSFQGVGAPVTVTNS